jgi:CheY-like chemotaxis protein/HPt (histidine-containing phosphotransfer) domain-containing protein
MPVATARNVELNLFIAPQVPACVWSDSTRLRQVLYNLAGNAIKFSAGRGERAGRVWIRVELSSEVPPRLILRIADDGIGIEPEALGKLFTAFTQADVATTRRFGGTGLGLAICKRLVTLMNGAIDVHSELGAGATFVVTLPIEEVAGSLPHPTEDVSDLDCIVVGSDFLANDLRDYLEHGGSRVFLADDVSAAAERAIGLERPVVIQSIHLESTSANGSSGASADDDSPSAPRGPVQLEAAFATTSGARQVWIARGPRRRSRLARADVVMLDGNCLRRSVFLRAVAVAAGRATPDALDDDKQVLAAGYEDVPTIADARAQGRLLLIAEDDEINRKVILRQTALLGYAAEMASNGIEALELWRAGSYGLLLTDLHMPEMDGHGLVETIRRDEASRGIAPGKGIPILALTANALRSEASRAEAAGMNEYLTKPLNLGLLKAALLRWLPPGEVAPARPRAASIDLAALRRILGENPAVLREILAEFRLSTQRVPADLRTAREREDTRQLATTAHALKSASRAVGALTVGDRCADLESACEIGIQGPISKAVAELEVALLSAHEEIGDLLREPKG